LINGSSGKKKAGRFAGNPVKIHIYHLNVVLVRKQNKHFL